MDRGTGVFPRMTRRERVGGWVVVASLIGTCWLADALYYLFGGGELG